MANQLNCSGLKCPIPIIKTATAIKNISVGSVLEVTATDPAFKIDIESWCNKTGNILISIEKREFLTIASIKKCH